MTSLTVPRTWLAEAFLLTDLGQGDWPEVVEYRRGLIGRGLIGDLQRLRQQSVVKGLIVEVGTGILTDCVPRNVFEQTFHN